MKSKELSENHYIIRLETGDEVNESVTKFCEENGIKNAAVWGIGSIESPTLGHYRMDRKKYSEKKVEGVFEILSLMGNVAVFEGRPLPHLHVTISDEDMKALGGHLVEGRCSATVEIIVRKFDSAHGKYPDEKVGLKLYDI